MWNNISQKEIQVIYKFCHASTHILAQKGVGSAMYVKTHPFKVFNEFGGSLLTFAMDTNQTRNYVAMEEMYLAD